MRCVGPRGAAGVTSRVSMGNQREVLFRARDGPRGFVTTARTGQETGLQGLLWVLWVRPLRDGFTNVEGLILAQDERWRRA